MGIKIVAENKKARHDYVLVESFEAGLVLMGSEAKSLRNGDCNLKDSYVSFRGNQAYLQSAHISPYKASAQFGHEPERLRKLLLHRHEIDRLMATTREKGLSLIPLKIYFKKGVAKVEVALARGKKKGDKRESTKTRDVNREIRQRLRKTR